MKPFAEFIFLFILEAFSAMAQDHEIGDLRLSARITAGNLDAPELDEVSGCVASSINKDVLWVHNDSGNDAVVHAMSAKGKLLCAVSIDNGRNRDWEDVAIGPGLKKGRSYLYIGDIGDNDGNTPAIAVHRVAEPSLDPLCKAMTVSAERIEITLTFVTELPFSLTTAADISRSGKSVIAKNYVYAYGWERKNNESLTSLFKRKPLVLPYIPEPQGEAVCFDKFYMSAVSSEDTKEIYIARYNVPIPAYIRISVRNEIMFEVRYH